MRVLLSPALNMEAVPGTGITLPCFEADAAHLADQLAAYTHWQLESVLRVNPALALRAFEAYQAFAAAPPSPALLSFRGLAFQGLCAATLTHEDLTWAQGHVAVLSALYGMLRPLDGLRPYRLDFTGRFRPHGQSLYAHWGDRVCRALFENGQTAVNLCSEEYARLVTPYLKPGDRLVTCRFLTPKGGRLAVVTTDAKSARGHMCRFIIQNRLTEPRMLAEFTAGGFRFSPGHSCDNTLVFIKEYA